MISPFEQPPLSSQLVVETMAGDAVAIPIALSNLSSRFPPKPSRSHSPPTSSSMIRLSRSPPTSSMLPTQWWMLPADDDRVVAIPEVGEVPDARAETGGKCGGGSEVDADVVREERGWSD